MDDGTKRDFRAEGLGQSMTPQPPLSHVTNVSPSMFSPLISSNGPLDFRPKIKDYITRVLLAFGTFPILVLRRVPPLNPTTCSFQATILN